jgi:hypothetical protein
MKKQIEIHGQRVELYSPDKGRTWSSSPQSIVAYGQRQEILRLELKQRFARMDKPQDPGLHRDDGVEMFNRFAER